MDNVNPNDDEQVFVATCLIWLEDQRELAAAVI